MCNENRRQIVRQPVLKDYGCNGFGTVFSEKSGSWKKISPYSDRGYLQFHTSIDGDVKNIHVHRFVYECFTQTTPNYSIKSGSGLVIDHIDGNKLNNCPENLQLITKRENTQKYYPCKYYSYNKKRKRFKVQQWSITEKKNKIYGDYKTEQEAIERVEELKKLGIIV